MARLRALGALFADAAPIVLAWVAALLLETVFVGVARSRELATAWEIAQIKEQVVPLSVTLLAPWALLVAGGWRLAESAAEGGRAARAGLAVLGAVAGAAVAIGVSGGRHFESGVVRAPFVALVAGGGALATASGLSGIASLGRRPLALAAVGGGLGLGGWLADAHVLPRLYEAFHVAALAGSLLGAALVGVALRLGLRLEGRARAVTTAVVWGLVAWSSRRAPAELRVLEPLDNLRLTLVEHAPILGRTVEVATLLHPPADAAPVSGSSASFTPGEVARALDWTGHDLVLVTVDALRADHVSAYGYARRTTPALDALAREGALFDAAYCPTPHTSYSITSMMTGKYLRPLLALGLGEDSDTWAQDLRLYGWRTAAFYPPAVFFIDEDRFTRFEQEHLGFEYAKVEFADPALRERQVAEYLDAGAGGRQLFLWVHFFEPHEPYVMHPEHPFSGGPSADVDAYDSEVATADEGIGRIVSLVRARRPGAVVIVTADHGEEFGEHGGRYHGTTVYEEQVRVPLVVAGAGVAPGSRVSDVVQTIDLLPTALSALGIPRPARVRGRDLGPLLAGTRKPGAPQDGGFAFAETDDYALVAAGGDRLVCERRAAACSLYRPAADPLERRDVSAQEPARFAALKGELRAVERDGGRFEVRAGAAWPEALRRGMMGDGEAALDVASLLDDADVGIRRKAAEVCFDLHAAATLPAVKRALARDEDDDVRRWTALAALRLGDPASALAEGLLKDASVEWRRRAALAFGGRGDSRACDGLAAWWSELAPSSAARHGDGDGGDGEPPRLPLELPAARELLGATAAARCKAALPGLVLALADVRARPYVADALGALGDDRARGPLRALLASEPYVTTRPHEARALLALGSRDWAATGDPVAEVRTTLPAPAGPTRVVALLSDPEAVLSGSVDGHAIEPAPGDGAVRSLALPAGHGRTVEVDLHVGGTTGTTPGGGRIEGLWVLPAAALD